MTCAPSPARWTCSRSERRADGAAQFVTARRQVANAVICLADSGTAWPIVDAQLALVRAASAAVLTAITPSMPVSESAEKLLLVVRYLSHAHPLDVALTAAFDRRILIAAEPDALAALSLPELLRERAERARGEIRVLTRMAGAPGPLPPPPMPPLPPLADAPRCRAAAEMPGAELPEMPGAEPPEMAGAEPPAESVFDAHAVEAAADEIAHLADGAFDHESGEASRVLDVQAAMESSLDAAVEAIGTDAPRLLQAYIGQKDAATRDNILRARSQRGGRVRRAARGARSARPRRPERGDRVR